MAAIYPVPKNTTGAFSMPGGTLTAAIPTHVTGDLLVAAVYAKSQNAVTHPSGWTLESSLLSADGLRATYIDWKIATSGSETAAWTATSQEWCVGVAVIPTGQFDPSDPVGTVTIGEGAETFETVVWADYTAGSRNENVLVGFGESDDDIPDIGWTSTPAVEDTRRFDFSTGVGADIGLFMRQLFLGPGEQATGMSVSLIGSRTNGYMPFVIPIRSTSSEVATTDNFSTNYAPDSIPVTPLWSAWEREDATSFCEIDAARLRMTTKTFTRTSALARMIGRQYTDVEFTFTMENTATMTGQNLYFWVRSSGGWATLQSVPRSVNEALGAVYVTAGCGFRFRFDQAAVVTSAAGVPSDVGATVNPGLSGAITVGFRTRIVGNAVKVRWWNTAGSEPGTWNIERTLTAPLAEGWPAMNEVRTGSATGLYMDNFTVENLAAPAAITGTGAATETDDTSTGSGTYTPAVPPSPPSSGAAVRRSPTSQRLARRATNTR